MLSIFFRGDKEAYQPYSIPQHGYEVDPLTTSRKENKQLPTEAIRRIGWV